MVATFLQHPINYTWPRSSAVITATISKAANALNSTMINLRKAFIGFAVHPDLRWGSARLRFNTVLN